MISKGDALKDIRYVMIYIGLPNLIIAIASTFIFFVRAIFILDYAALCLVAPYVSRRVFFLLLVPMVTLDLLFSIAPSFHFNSSDFLFYSYSVIFMYWPLLALAILLIVLIVVLLFLSKNPFLLQKSAISYRSRIVVVVCSLMLVGLDVLNGTNGHISGRLELVRENIAGTHLPQFIKVFVRHNAVTSPSNYKSVDGATGSLLKSLVDGEAPSENKVLLVVVESLGLPANKKLRDLYTEVFESSQLQKRYMVRYGEVNFSGGTVIGEIRELCGLRIRSIDDASNVIAENCLPMILKKFGYKTIALHGYSRHMFNRNSWYRRIGFDETFFVDEIDATGYTRRCGNLFRGSCDSDIAKLIQKQLSQSDKNKQFIYWLTLNSHFPVATDSALNKDDNCEAVNNQQVCRLNTLLIGLMSNITGIADKYQGSLRIIIVGDHAPHLSLKSDKALFMSEVVPFIEIVSKTQDGLHASK